MFLEKLWLRLRGELLAFKEDFGDDTDLREKAERLLEKLETRLRTTEAEGSRWQKQRGASEDELGEPPGPESLRAIEKEWQDLQKQRRQQQPKPETAEPSEPNPRKLG